MSPEGELARWAGQERRFPTRSSATWAVRAPLAAWLRKEAEAGHGYRVLDVGCGPKPYYPFFAERAVEYIGVDVVENPAAELRGAVEELPVDDESFDLVLCTQVLEHCDDPAQAVRELRRVTAPGGRVLASTHGTQVYHPSPQDYWRWTHAGLSRLFTEHASWSSVNVSPGAGTATTLAMLLSTYVEIALRRTALARPPVWLLNTAGAVLDARVRLLREPVPGSLFANFHVVATVAPRDASGSARA
jgi:SAM-dependent methyltransferase